MICPIDSNLFCSRHNRRHIGHAAAIALDPSPEAEAYRRVWDGGGTFTNAQPARLLRSLPLAKQCQYFGERLTPDEVKEKQLAGCRSCSGEVPAFHCKLPDARKFNDGPYTRGAECMGCRDWKPYANVQGVLPVNGEWVKDPNVWAMFRQMIQQELASLE